ncbi:hypothetical protein FRC10_003020, partial [Ceratobasidium sp. 414]
MDESSDYDSDGRPEPTSKCPCCSQMLGRRQIDRHIEELAGRMVSSPSDVEMSDDEGSNAGGILAAADDLGHGDGLGAVEDPGAVGGLGAGEDLGAGDRLGVDQVPGQMPIDDPNNIDPAVLPLLAPIYRLLLNPPVAINDWAEPGEHEEPEANESDDEEPIGGNPALEYVEREAPLGLDPNDEPDLADDELRNLFEENMEDLDDDEWIELYSRVLSKKDRKTLELLAIRLRAHFTRSTWDDLRLGVCQEYAIPSEFIAWRRLRILAGLETRIYDCCINSCCCFLGKYAALDKCPFCKENRYNARGTARRFFRYTPLIPQLRGMFQDPSMSAKLRYRANFEQEREPDVVKDVFDGENYRKLRETPVKAAGEYRFFSNPEDIALGLSTDGFRLFKREFQGHSSAWPIIFLNYNLPPNIRTRLEYVLCVGVIPGPNQCKDFNSFFAPVVEELLELERGLNCSGFTPEGIAYNFVLRAFIIIIFGDIPALTKLLLMKGHNALTPCRACYIQGTRRADIRIYYIPLKRPNARTSFPLDKLPMRTQEFFNTHYKDIEADQTEAAREQQRKDTGVTGRSILTRLQSIDLPSSAPYDIMHLLFENLVPNMVRHWTGAFKDLDQGMGNYELEDGEWERIGELTTQATKTIPSAFVGTLPDIAQRMNLFKAEAYSFWIQYIAPIVLKGKIPDKYYRHIILLREIIMRCLLFQITSAQIDELQVWINTWVTDYEKYYYQYDQ